MTIANHGQLAEGKSYLPEPRLQVLGQVFSLDHPEE
jgi:hypothetical protein